MIAAPGWRAMPVPLLECGTLEQAGLGAVAARPPRRGTSMLLSPACASFDQFADFEARGERFRELVASGIRRCLSMQA